MEPILRSRLTTKRVLFTSLIVDIIDVVTNLAVAIFTGSVVMLAETLQGLADLSSVSMLMIGNYRSHKRATKLHPFGYGKELYYWSTLAAFIIVALTATLSFNFGYHQFQNPTPVRHIFVAYFILVVAIFSNGYALLLSARKLLENKQVKDLYRAFMDSPMIAPKTTLVLDAMGTMAAVFGLIALVLYKVTSNTTFDGIGAMIVGVILAFSALILLMSIRSLVTGQSASPETERKIRDAAREVSEVKHVLGMRTMLLGSDKLLVNIEVHLKDGLSTDQVEEAIQKIKEAIEDTAKGEGLRVHVEPDAYHDVHQHQHLDQV